MNIKERYRRLTIWNKLAFWGSITSFIGLLFPLIQSPSIYDVILGKLKPLDIVPDVSDSGDRVFLNTLNNKSVHENIARCDSLPTWYYFDFTLKSRSTKYQINIAPFMLLDIISVEPLPKNIICVEQGGKGEGEHKRVFMGAMLSSQRGIFGAPHIITYENWKGLKFPTYDYYSLRYSEEEIFELWLHYEPGFIYTFKVGIPYRINNVDQIWWYNKILKIGVPNAEVKVYYWDDNHNVSSDSEMKEMWGYYDPEGVLSMSVQLQNYMAKQRIFTIIKQ